jgi:hypothetical protein
MKKERGLKTKNTKFQNLLQIIPGSKIKPYRNMVFKSGIKLLASVALLIAQTIG